MEELTITDLDLGSVIPFIKDASEPWYDDRGLWAHLDIDYSGNMKISLATKLNLMSFKKMTNNVNDLNDVNQQKQRTQRVRHLGITNSDEEDSADDSSGDEYPMNGNANEKNAET